MVELNKIMHIEDDPDILEIVKVVLGTIGCFDLAQCISGADALEIAPKFRPDLFLVDSVMPGMDGLETLRELRKLPEFANTPIIFLTAKASPEEIQIFIDAGAIEVFTKPFDPVTLVEKIKLAWDFVSG